MNGKGDETPLIPGLFATGQRSPRGAPCRDSRIAWQDDALVEDRSLAGLGGAHFFRDETRRLGSLARRGAGVPVREREVDTDAGSSRACAEGNRLDSVAR